MIRKNYFYNVALSLTNILFPLLSFPYVSRILGPNGIGKVQFIISFAQYFALFAALGIPIYGIQEIAKVRHNKNKLDSVFSELVFIYFVTSVLSSIAYLALIFSVSFFDVNLELYGYASLLVLLGFSTIDWFYAGMEDFKTMALRSIAVKLVSLVLLYLLVKTASDFRNYLFITIFSMLGNNVINFLIIGRKTKFAFPGKSALRHLKPLFYIFSTTAAASIYAILDTVLLGFLSNEKSVGLYLAAVKIAKVAIPFITSAGLILIPQISKKMEESDQPAVQSHLDAAYRFIAFFSVPITIGMLTLAPECILVFSGQKFIEATTSMQIVSVLPVLVGFGFFFAFLVLVPGGRHKQMFYSAVVGVGFSLLMNFWLVPLFDHKGTSIANVLSELLVTCMYLYFVRKYFKYQYNWYTLLHALLCSLSFFPIVMLVRALNLNALLTLLVSVSVCAGVYFLLQHYACKNPFVLKVLNFSNIKFGLKKPVE